MTFSFVFEGDVGGVVYDASLPLELSVFLDPFEAGVAERTDGRWGGPGGCGRGLEEVGGGGWEVGEGEREGGGWGGAKLKRAKGEGEEEE